MSTLSLRNFLSYLFRLLLFLLFCIPLVFSFPSQVRAIPGHQHRQYGVREWPFGWGLCRVCSRYFWRPWRHRQRRAPGRHRWLLYPQVSRELVRRLFVRRVSWANYNKVIYIKKKSPTSVSLWGFSRGALPAEELAKPVAQGRALLRLALLLGQLADQSPAGLGITPDVCCQTFFRSSTQHGQSPGGWTCLN